MEAPRLRNETEGGLEDHRCADKFKMGHGLLAISGAAKDDARTHVTRIKNMRSLSAFAFSLANRRVSSQHLKPWGSNDKTSEDEAP